MPRLKKPKKVVVEKRRARGTGSIFYDKQDPRIRRVDASTVGFTVNDGTEVTATGNIPTATLSPFIAITNTTANAKSVDIDYFDLMVRGISR